jgi:Domain of unknown function (DUF4158)
MEMVVFTTLQNDAAPGNPHFDRAMQLLAFPDAEGELIRKYTLSRADLAFVRQHRGDHNRLGIAVQMCSLRYPGRVLRKNERPPDRLLNLVGRAARHLHCSVGHLCPTRRNPRTFA